MVVATVLGWGLVVNSFAGDASWNNWQGYLLEPLGLGTFVDDPAGPYWDGTWPYANLGVLLALVLSFLVTLVARRAHGPPPGGRHVTDRPWLVAIDLQRVFGDPSSAWCAPRYAAAAANVRAPRRRLR